MSEHDWVGSILAMIERVRQNQETRGFTVMVGNDVWDKVVAQLGRAPTAEDVGYPFLRHPLIPGDHVYFSDLTEEDVLSDIRHFTYVAVKDQ